jgi:hypothetical protein
MKPAGVDAMPPWGVNNEDAMDLSFPLVSFANEQMTPRTSWHDASPIDGNVVVAEVELDSAPDGAPSIRLAAIIQPFFTFCVVQNVDKCVLSLRVIFARTPM